MNYTERKGHRVFEFAILVGALALVFTGAGAYSLDAVFNTGL